MNGINLYLIASETLELSEMISLLVCRVSGRWRAPGGVTTTSYQQYRYILLGQTMTDTGDRIRFLTAGTIFQELKARIIRLKLGVRVPSQKCKA